MKLNLFAKDVGMNPAALSMPVNAVYRHYSLTTVTSGISTGRKCDGYEPLPETKPIRFVTLMHVTYPPNEVRSFQYFQEKTLSQLFTFIHEDIWTSHIVQTANLDQGIWHSVIALSSFHENFVRHGYSGPQNHDRFALKQYNMSIQGILASERNTSNAHVHLISCILFICIEVCQLLPERKPD